jgi:pyruvate,water dikinase
MAAALSARPETERPRLRERAAVARRLAAEDELRAALPRSKRALVRPLGRVCGTQVRCMERTKAAFMMAFDGVRRACELIGADLTERGLLAEPSDAAYLTVDELLGELPADPKELTGFRRERREYYRTLALPMTFIGVPEPSTAAPDASAGADGEITGVAGSAGRMAGTARVLLDLDDCGELEPGEVLVCRYTDPSWVAAMSLAGALVIDVGAAASHGAIVARELGIPCVIGTGTGTARIRTGDRLDVDGTTGVVRILART